jgi:hypothetical protein
MITLLIALAAAPAPVEGQATLQSCEMTASGWVCHYSMPPVTLIGTPDGQQPGTVAPPSVPTAIVVPPPIVAPQPATEADKAEAARRSRLIARCADAGWFAACLPGERREARRLRDEAEANAALRTKVTGLLSENKCTEAVKVALAGGDMALAREARAFCNP